MVLSPEVYRLAQHVLIRRLCTGTSPNVVWCHLLRRSWSISHSMCYRPPSPCNFQFVVPSTCTGRAMRPSFHLPTHQWPINSRLPTGLGPSLCQPTPTNNPSVYTPPQIARSLQTHRSSAPSMCSARTGYSGRNGANGRHNDGGAGGVRRLSLTSARDGFSLVPTTGSVEVNGGVDSSRLNW